MTVGCCGCGDRPGQDDEGGGGQRPVSEAISSAPVSEAISSALYARFGRVERYRHADTIVFLGVALLVCYSLVLIVQHASHPATCTLATPINSLPGKVQTLLRNNEATWSCPGGGDYDFVMSLELGQFIFGTSNSSVTEIMPKGCSVQPSNAETDSSVPTSCPDWPQCDNIEKYIWDKNCQLQFPGGRSSSRSSSSVWGWYFSLTSVVLAGLLLLIFIFKLTVCCCGGKREGIAVIV